MVASSLQLEKACTQQQRPNTTKNKINKEVNLEKKRSFRGYFGKVRYNNKCAGYYYYEQIYCDNIMYFNTCKKKSPPDTEIW